MAVQRCEGDNQGTREGEPQVVDEHTGQLRGDGEVECNCKEAKIQMHSMHAGMVGDFAPKIRMEKQPKVKVFLFRIFVGHQGPTRHPGPGMSRTKTLCKAPLSVVLEREWPDVPRFGSGRPGI